MKIDRAATPIQSSGIVAEQKFTIQPGAHIMAVLSGLYKNPVDAMVREYLTNMYDAYVAMQAQQPHRQFIAPEIHAPTTFSPQLEFHDFGIGMSFSQVWDVYSQYGNSTKNGDNNSVGGFGLGSKTAFCYNEGQSWTIESRHNGEKFVFLASINADGIPSLFHVSTETTEQPNGVSIKIPIRREDINGAHIAIQTYAPYFPLEIVVKGMTPSPAPISYSMRGETWGVRHAGTTDIISNRHARGVTRIVMGNVPYEVSLSSFMIINANVDSATRRRIDNIHNMPLDIYVPIGSVDIVPSRDDLKYTPKTVATLTAAVEEVMNGIQAKMNETLAACPTPWAAYLKILEWYFSIYSLRSGQRTDTFCNYSGVPFSHSGYTFHKDIGMSVKTSSLKLGGAKIVRYAIGEYYRHGNDGKRAVFVTDINKDDNINFINAAASAGNSDPTMRPVTNVVISRESNPSTTRRIFSYLTEHYGKHSDRSGRLLKNGHRHGVIYEIVSDTLTPNELQSKLLGFPLGRIHMVEELNVTKIAPISRPKNNAGMFVIDRNNSYSAIKIKRAPRLDPAITGFRYYVPVVRGADGDMQVKITNTIAAYPTEENLRALYNTYEHLQTEHTHQRAHAQFAMPNDCMLYGVLEANVFMLDSKLWVNLLDTIHKVIVADVNKHREAYAHWYARAYDSAKLPLVWSSGGVSRSLNALLKTKYENAFLEKLRDTASPAAQNKGTGPLIDSCSYISWFVLNFPRLKDTRDMLQTISVTTLKSLVDELQVKYPFVWSIFSTFGSYHNLYQFMRDNEDVIINYMKEMDNQSI